tara:strand:+ start:232 stop:489 length:258 start_codon:yes stop_codon:yes gene_type:complete
MPPSKRKQALKTNSGLDSVKAARARETAAAGAAAAGVSADEALAEAAGAPPDEFNLLRMRSDEPKGWVRSGAPVVNSPPSLKKGE